MTYKVFIPSAGMGSRLGPHTKFRNKALITLGDLPVIAHQIKKFPENVEEISRNVPETNPEISWKIPGNSKGS